MRIRQAAELEAGNENYNHGYNTGVSKSQK